MRARLDRGLDELFVRDVVPPVPDVIGDRHPEQNRFLRHEPDLIAQPMDVQVGQLGRIQIDLRKRGEEGRVSGSSYIGARLTSM